jgi:hypothetical protein
VWASTITIGQHGIFKAIIIICSLIQTVGKTGKITGEPTLDSIMHLLNIPILLYGEALG